MDQTLHACVALLTTCHCAVPPRLEGPCDYKRVKVNDGVKERPALEVDPATAPVVREIVESSLRGNGLKETRKALNDRGITNRGKR